jgi:hypothetical protein
MTVSWHSESLRLLQSQPDATDLPGVLQWQSRRYFELPPAIREFYANPTLTAVVNMQGGDHVVSVDELNADHAAIKHRLLFMVENQGVYLWAAMLDGSDDPPVRVREHAKNKRWQSCCPNFSTYVYTRVFENQFWKTDGRGHGVNNDLDTFLNFGPAELRFMRSRFKEEPKTLGGYGPVYRFSDGWHKRVIIYDAHPGATVAITASDPENFESLKSLLRPQWPFAE